MIKTVQKLQLTISRFFWHLLRPIGQLFEVQWAFEHSQEFEIGDIFLQKGRFCPCSNFLQRLSVLLLVDQFRRKRCQTKCKGVDYKLLYEFFQKYYMYRMWFILNGIVQYSRVHNNRSKVLHSYSYLTTYCCQMKSSFSLNIREYHPHITFLLTW